MLLEREKILIIKDNEQIARLLAHMLERQGYDVFVVTSVAKAWEFLREEPCTLILIDMPLQSLLVRQEVRQLCEVPERQADVMLLVDEQIDLSLDGLDILVEESMSKPVRSEMLISAVKRHIRNARLERKLEYYRKLAIYDDLTNTYNRRYFNEIIEREFSRSQRSEQSLSVLMADVDDFKEVNDTHGHRAGDQVLGKVAQALQMSLRGMDIICRYGGEEFVIILPETGKEKAMGAAERLRRIVETTGISLHERQPVPVTISIGVATYPADAPDKETLILHADKALYYAKQMGKNRSCAWNNEKDSPMICSQPDNIQR